MALAALGFGLAAGVAVASPDADFDVSTGTPAVGESVNFRAEDSCAPPVTCDWSFGDGQGAGGRSVSHAYDSPGSYTVRLTVDDPEDDDEPESESRTIRVSARNRPPSAAISPASATAGPGQPVRFDSSGSSDPDGDALARAWDMDGDGFDDGDGVTATRAFPVGTHTVRVRVTDPGGESDTASARVTVANRAPTASIRASDTRPLSLSNVKFTAQAADPDGSIAKWEWDFDKDGFDDGSGASVTRSFRVPGIVDARLRVTDNRGATATATLRITVRNQDPRAAFTYTPTPVRRGEAVALKSQSVDPEGRLDKHEWDFDSDGKFDDATGANPSKTFPASLDRINVRLRVTDKDGGSNVRAEVIVPGNLSPTATLTASPPSPLTGELVTFTAGASDPDGTIVSYRWELDGVAVAGEGPSLTASFTTPGPHEVTLEVTDDAGAVSTLRKAVAVVDRAPLIFTFAPNPVFAGVPVTFTASATDPTATFEALAWDLDGDGGFDDGTGTAVTTVYPAPANVFVGLSAADADGKPVAVYREIAVLAPTDFTATPPSVPGPQMMRPFPVVRFAGRLTARGARLELLTVRAPKGARIAVVCRGHGCPRPRIVRTARVERLRGLQTTYRAGARITLRITAPGVIGKFVRIKIRKDVRPRRTDSCVWPGERAPRACPS